MAKETLGERLAREARVQGYLRKLNKLYAKDFERQGLLTGKSKERRGERWQKGSLTQKRLSHRISV